MAFSSPNDDIERQAPSEGEAHGFVADEAVEAGQVVKLTSDNAVSPSDSAGEATIGVAAQSVESGDTVMVLGNSARVLFTAAESISVNDPLTPDPSTNEGEVQTANTTADKIIGYALESAGAQGDTFVGVVDRGGEVN
jgi:hypothetical protein